MNTRIASERPKTMSRTGLYEFLSLKTLRFEWINVAGRIVNMSGAKVPKLSQSPKREKVYDDIVQNLDRMKTDIAA